MQQRRGNSISNQSGSRFSRKDSSFQRPTQGQRMNRSDRNFAASSERPWSPTEDQGYSDSPEHDLQGHEDARDFSQNSYTDNDYGSNATEHNDWNSRAARPQYPSASDYSYDQDQQGRWGGGMSFERPQQQGGQYGQGAPYSSPRNTDRYATGSSSWQGQGSGGQGSSYGQGSPSYSQGASSYGQGSTYNQSNPATTQRPWNENSMGGSQQQTGRYHGVGPKGYTRSDDRLKEEICDMLTRHHEIDASDVEVEVKDGEVTLTGSVPDRRMKHMVEDATERSYGIKEIHNQIKVKRSEGSSASSTESESSMSPKTTAAAGKKSSSGTGSH